MSFLKRDMESRIFLQIVSSDTPWMACLPLLYVYFLHLLYHKALVIITQCPDLSFFVCHTKRRVLVTCSENEKESGSQGERQEHENEKKEAIFTNCCHLLSILLLIIVLIRNQQCSPEHNFLFKTRG